MTSEPEPSAPGDKLPSATGGGTTSADSGATVEAAADQNTAADQNAAAAADEQTDTVEQTAAGEGDSASGATTSGEDRGASDARPSRGRRILVGSLFALAVIVGLFAVLAVWGNRQALNTDNVANTSSKILADKQVQTVLGSYLVTQLFNSVNVQGELQSVLPGALQPVAGPLASGLREVANDAAPRILALHQVQVAFKQAVRAAHATFMKIVNGGGSAVSTNGGVVKLNLQALVTQLADTLGLSSQLNTAKQKIPITLPAGTGEITIIRSDQLKLAQDIASAISGLAIVLPLVAAALFALAIYLARGRRRQALRTTGWCLVWIGVLVLLFRRVGGNVLVNELVTNDSNKVAINHVWVIGTSLLYDIAVAIVIYGLIIVIAAWIAGRTRPATALRRSLAPTLRDRPVVAYVVVGFVFLLVILWGPTPAFRQFIPILIIAALLVLGIELLRRSTAVEFPRAQKGDTVRGLRDWYAAQRA
jgi:hypothetical protein